MAKELKYHALLLMNKYSIKRTWSILKKSLSAFSDDKAFKLSAALAYYTVFSLGPLLLMVISLTSIFYGREAVEGKIYSQLESFVGHDTAIQLQHIIQNAVIIGKGKLAAILGGIALLLGATSIFGEIQDSINLIWSLKPKPKKGWLKFLQNRLLSFSVIVGLGFLLLVSLVFSSVIDAFSSHLKTIFPNATVVLFYIFNLVAGFLISVLVFGTIFKVLPDAKIKWNQVLAGAVMTSIFFMLGKFAISFYISKSHIGSTYGTAGSLVVLLLWVYYSSVILYFGAEFTQAFAVASGTDIEPAEYAVITKQVEVETDKKAVDSDKKKIVSSHDHA
jgi:membrane protein